MYYKSIVANGWVEQLLKHIEINMYINMCLRNGILIGDIHLSLLKP